MDSSRRFYRMNVVYLTLVLESLLNDSMILLNCTCRSGGRMQLVVLF